MRKRTPTALRILTGNPSGQKLPDAEPQHEELCEDTPPPEYLTGVAREEWLHVVPLLAKSGVLMTTDERTVAAYCNAWAHYLEAQERLTKDGFVQVFVNKLGMPHAQMSVGCKAALEWSKELRHCMNELGLTPASRSKVVVDKAKQAKKAGGWGSLAQS